MQKKTTFEKTQFLQSKTWEYSRDLTDAVLEDNKQYTKEEAKEEIKTYLNRKQKGGF